MTSTDKTEFDGQYLLMKFKEVANLLSEKYPELLDDANEHLQELLLEIWRGQIAVENLIDEEPIE